MSYVDGFVLPVPEKKLAEYRKIALKAGKIWRDHGAIQYIEAAGDDLDIKEMLSFRKLAKPKPGETVVFAWILYKSRKHRDQVNKKVMADPRIKGMCGGDSMPFDVKRMAYGGFKVMVEN
jgi:uncharacterized protein YbaA (DUF1428 family)